MARIVSIHSFRGGTGKSNTTANVASLLAADGKRVAVVDCDMLSPGVHVLFGVDQEAMGASLNDYLWGRCEIAEAAHEVTPPTAGGGGRLWLVPSSMKAHDIARVMHEGYDVATLKDGFRALIDKLSLDVLLLDTHPGLNEETLLSIAMSNALVIVLRPDRQDYEGTQVTVSVARKLRVPQMVLVVNKTPATFDPADVERLVAETYECEVAAVLPHSDELMALSSEAVFAVRNPDHPLTAQYRQIAARLLA
jgi:MinD-like ATPase involved in chromosome partitioning or flagellar assembly